MAETKPAVVASAVSAVAAVAAVAVAAVAVAVAFESAAAADGRLSVAHLPGGRG